jgi:multiple sugar transport system ATP-binding protein
MRAEVSRIQRRVGVATLYVTHDQVEAMTMGDRVAVLSGGILQQCDSPQVLYDNPKNLFVAGFMGSPAMNLFEATISDGASSVLIGTQRIDLAATVLTTRPGLKAYSGRGVVVGIRPEDLPIARTEGTTAAPAVFEGTVELVEALGSEQLVHFTSDAHQVEVGGTKDDDAEGLNEGTLAKSGEGVARVDARAQLTTGGRVRFGLEPSRIHFFDPATGQAIAG